MYKNDPGETTTEETVEAPAEQATETAEGEAAAADNSEGAESVD